MMSTFVDDVREKIAKLETLGTPDAIAFEMEAQGIRAKRGCATRCVVAMYLGNGPAMQSDERGLPVNFVTVGNYTVHAFGGDVTDIAAISLPAVVKDFVRRFDYGDYPALDAAIAGAVDQ